MELKYKQFILKFVFTGNKSADWGDKIKNYNHYRITVFNTVNEKKISFDFWASIANPRIKTKYELLNAFYCFFNDAYAGQYDFNEFCGEFGYDTDSRRAHKTWKACKKAMFDLEELTDSELFDDDLQALYDELAEIAG